ncbi:MAG: hypothetical protein LQ348_005622 [Seirophora lacunosa]|nr:MAG: hypothetical protein LQ348_005622 [Seirophora lacunosa]
MGAPSPQAISWPAYQIASVPGDMVSQIEQANANLSLDHHHLLPCWPSAESLSGQKRGVRPLTTKPPSWRRIRSSTQRVPTEIHNINPPSPNTSPGYHPRKGGARGGIAQPIRPRNIDHNSGSPSRFAGYTSSPEEAHDGRAQRTSARTMDYISYWPKHSSHSNHSQKEVQGGIAQGAPAATPHLTSYSPNPSPHTNFHQEEAQSSTTQLTPLEFTSTTLRSPYASPRSRPNTEEAPGRPALLSPFEFAYDDVDDDFGRKVCEAYLLSQQRQEEREGRYGVVIAREWKRGSTPIEAREAWAMELERRWDALSDSSEDDGEGGTRPKQRFQPG